MNQSRGLTIWVTGARGFLGRHIARDFVNHGYAVAGMGRGEWGEHDDWGLLTWVSAPVSYDSFEQLRKATGLPHLLFHAAGTGTVGASESEPSGSYRDTVDSTRSTLDWLHANSPDTILIYPSSCAVYGVAKAPTPESSRRAPISTYGKQKLEVEDLFAKAQARGLRYGIIRYFSVYGSGLRKQLLWDLAKMASTSGSVKLGGTGSEKRDFLHVSDAARLARVVSEHLLDRSESTIIVNGGSGSATSIRKVAELMIEALPYRATLHFNEIVRSGDPTIYEADTTLASSLGFVPSRTIDAGLSEYADWVVNELGGT